MPGEQLVYEAQVKSQVSKFDLRSSKVCHLSDSTCRVELETAERLVFSGYVLLRVLSGHISVFGYDFHGKAADKTDTTSTHETESATATEMLDDARMCVDDSDSEQLDDSDKTEESQTWNLLSAPIDSANSHSLAIECTKTAMIELRSYDAAGIEWPADCCDAVLGIGGAFFHWHYSPRYLADSDFALLRDGGRDEVTVRRKQPRRLLVDYSWRKCVNHLLSIAKNANQNNYGTLKSGIDDAFDCELPAAALRVMAVGPTAVGKSTFVRYLVNRLLSATDCEAVYVVDTDIGQCLFTAEGMVSICRVTQPLLTGASDCPLVGQRPAVEVVRSRYVGDVSPLENPQKYIDCIEALANDLKNATDLDLGGHCPVVLNTDGWVTSLGSALLRYNMALFAPRQVIELVTATVTAKDGGIDNGHFGGELPLLCSAHLKYTGALKMLTEPLSVHSHFGDERDVMFNAAVGDVHMAAAFVEDDSGEEVMDGSSISGMSAVSKKTAAKRKKRIGRELMRKGPVGHWWAKITDGDLGVGSCIGSEKPPLSVDSDRSKWLRFGLDFAAFTQVFKWLNKAKWKRLTRDSANAGDKLTAVLRAVVREQKETGDDDDDYYEDGGDGKLLRSSAEWHSADTEAIDKLLLNAVLSAELHLINAFEAETEEMMSSASLKAEECKHGEEKRKRRDSHSSSCKRVVGSGEFSRKRANALHRSLRLTSYLIGGRLPTATMDALCTLPAYTVPFEAVAIHFTSHCSVKPSLLLHALNGTVVAIGYRSDLQLPRKSGMELRESVSVMCEERSKKRARLSDSGGIELTVIRPKADNCCCADTRCVGLGVVRSIDARKRCFYIVTPVAKEQLAKCNVLLRGNCTLPPMLNTATGRKPLYIDMLQTDSNPATTRPLVVLN